MTGTIVTYRVHPGRTEENAERIRAVYAELASVAPDGFRYATFLREDGVSFVHMAFGDGPLGKLASFQAFRDRLPAEAPPETTRLQTLIGSYAV